MLYSIRDREDLEKFAELALLQNQVKDLRLQDRLWKQNFHEHMKYVVEPVTETIKSTSEDLTKTMTLASKEDNKAISDLNEKLSKILNDNGMLAPNLASSLVNLFKPENESQFKLIKEINSIKMNDFLLNTIIPVTLYSNMLIIRDRKKSFKLDEDLSKAMTN